MRTIQKYAITSIFLILPSVTFAQEINSFRTFNITLDTRSPADVLINRGRLVWNDVDINTSKLYLKYYSGAEIFVLDSLLQGVRAAIDGDHIAWNTDAEEMKSYNTRTWITTTIGSSYNPDGRQPVSVANGFLAYAARKGGPGTVIRLRNIAASTDTTLDAALWNTEPSLHHRQVAWVGSALEDSLSASSILFSDGRSARVVSDSANLSNRNPILKDGDIVWLQRGNGPVRVKALVRDSLLTLLQPPQVLSWSEALTSATVSSWLE